MGDDDGDRLARIVAETLHDEEMPDFDEFNTAGWAVQDTIERGAGVEA